MNAVENDGRLPRRQQPAFSVGVAVRGVTALNTRSSPHRNSLPVPLRALVRLREDRDCTRCNEQLCRPAWKLLTYVQVVERPGWVPYRSRQYINTDHHIMPLLYRCLLSKSPTRYATVCTRVGVTRPSREAPRREFLPTASLASSLQEKVSE